MNVEPRTPKRPKPERKWLELSVVVPFEYVEPVAELFRRYGKGGVAIEEAGGYNPDEGEAPPPRPSATVRTYMPQTPAYRTNREIVHIGVQLIGKLTSLDDLVEREITEREWEEAWKAHFTPLHIGRLIVKPPWHDAPVGADGVIVEIDPGLAFGTGHHPTTHRVLDLADRLVQPGMNVADVGAGSAILSVAAAKLGAARVLGVELDAVALKAGRANVRHNGMSGSIRLYAGSLPNPHIPNGWADLCLANVNAIVLARLAPELATLLKAGGQLVASGILADRRGPVDEAFAAAGLAIVDAYQDDDWVTLLARRE